MKWNMFLLIIILPVVGCGNDMRTANCDNVPEFTSDSIAEVTASYRNSLEQVKTFDEFIIDIRFIPEKNQSNHNTYGNLTKFRLNFSLFEKANATSCVPPKYRETISYINITSDKDFNDEYLAGQSLNNVFNVSFLKGSIEDILYAEPLYAHGFNLALKSWPTLNSRHNLQIEIMLDSGKDFSLFLEEVTFDL